MKSCLHSYISRRLLRSTRSIQAFVSPEAPSARFLLMPNLRLMGYSRYNSPEKNALKQSFQRCSILIMTRNWKRNGRINTLILDLRLPLRGSNVSVMHLLDVSHCDSIEEQRTYLGGKFQTGQRLGQVGLQRADHNEHQCLAISAQRILQEIGQLCAC